MPSLTAGALEECLLHKLRAKELPGRHRRFEIFDTSGRLLARTAMSRSWRGSTAISAGMVSSIKKQLHLAQSSDLVDLVNCTLTREGYLGMFP